MSRSRAMGFRHEIRRVADAWCAASEPDLEALAALAAEDADGELAARHRAGPALCRVALAAADGTIEPAPGWRQQRLAAAGRQLLLVDSLERVGKALTAAAVPWAPIKGLDLVTRTGVYDAPEDRPSSDLDLLIPEDRLDDARRALEPLGAQGLTSGPRAESYLRDEGYAWQAALPSSVLVELHFRLWAQVPSSMARAMLDEAETEAEAAPAGGRRLRASHAYLLAAVHAFTVPAPRGAGIWRDLAELSHAASNGGRADAWTNEVSAEAERFDLQLPLALAAAASASLFRSLACGRIAEMLRASWRPAERRLVALDDELAGVDVSLGRVVLGRHLAGRRSRRGLVHAAWRRVWPHPGVVEAAVPAGWQPVRRLRYLLRRAARIGRA